MGVRVVAVEHGAYPRESAIVFTCDNITHETRWSHEGQGIATFHGNGIECLHEAFKSGWKESPTGFWHCPNCSGKKKIETRTLFDG